MTVRVAHAGAVSRVFQACDEVLNQLPARRERSGDTLRKQHRNVDGRQLPA